MRLRLKTIQKLFIRGAFLPIHMQRCRDSSSWPEDGRHSGMNFQGTPRRPVESGLPAGYFLVEKTENHTGND
jgi:hypothetical protein